METYIQAVTLIQHHRVTVQIPAKKTDIGTAAQPFLVEVFQLRLPRPHAVTFGQRIVNTKAKAKRKALSQISRLPRERNSLMSFQGTVFYIILREYGRQSKHKHYQQEKEMHGYKIIKKRPAKGPLFSMMNDVSRSSCGCKTWCSCRDLRFCGWRWHLAGDG